MLARTFHFIFALSLVTMTGCMTRPSIPPQRALSDDGSHGPAMKRAVATAAHLYPASYRATQRAIVTVHGRQFTCDGLLVVSPTEGHHLALVSSFGVVTDLRVTPAGQTELLKVTPLFREDWSRNYVARDLRRLFVPPASLTPAGVMADGELVLQMPVETDGTVAQYIFSPNGEHWKELDLSRAGKTYYRATIQTHGAMPDEFDVTAETYQLELRSYATPAEGKR